MAEGSDNGKSRRLNLKEIAKKIFNLNGFTVIG
jgi:hypothetical protein